MNIIVPVTPAWLKSISDAEFKLSAAFATLSRIRNHLAVCNIDSNRYDLDLDELLTGLGYQYRDAALRSRLMYLRDKLADAQMFAHDVNKLISEIEDVAQTAAIELDSIVATIEHATEQRTQ